MSNEQILLSFLIKEGAHQLIAHVQTTLIKKKGKKTHLIEQIPAIQSSALEFIELPKRPQVPYFHNQIIRSLQGKNRQCIFDDKNQDKYLADISKFRLLYDKYLIPPRRNIQSKDLIELDEIKFKAFLGFSLFQNYCKDPSLQTLFLKTSQSIQESNKYISSLTFFQISKRSNGMNFKETEVDHILYCEELTQKLYESNRSVYLTSQSFIEQIRNNCRQIHLQQERKKQECMINYLNILNLKQIAEPTKIITSWPSNLFQRQKKQIISSQISGKMLFQVEEQIRKTKEITNKLDFNHQHQFRQKNIGIHSFMHRQSNKFQYKRQNSPQQIIQLGQIKGKPIPYSENEQSNYLKMFQRLNNLKKKQDLNPKNSLSQRNKLLVPSARPIPTKRSNLPTGHSNSYHNFNLKPLKPSPLRLDDLEKYQYQPHKPPINIKRQSIPKKQIKKQSQYKQSIQTNDFPKKKINFPIKIQHFQMASMEDSFLSYPIESINLKQLPLRFLKDRHKFKENRVKIEYPCRTDPNTEQLLRKSMQVLNCLGAEVSYKTYHSVDQDDVLAVSWLIQCPVKDVIKLYSQFFGKCPTKK